MVRIASLLAIVALAIGQIFLGKYAQYAINLISVYVIVALGLNILTGYTGQLSIGHAGFFAIGAYVSGILVTKAAVSFWLALPLTAVISLAAGFILGLPALRLTGLYLAMATMGFGYIVQEAIVQWSSMTGGSDGIKIGRPSIGPFTFHQDRMYFYVILAMVLILFAVSRNLLRSKIGRAFVSIRDSEIAAQSTGVSLAKYKTLAFAISAAYTGIAGSLYAPLIGYINPENFDIFLSIEFVAMIVIGGLGSLLGSLLGAILLTILPEVLRGLKELQGITYGIAMLIFILFFPKGISGLLSQLNVRFLK